jgi:hypothetical protein
MQRSCSHHTQPPVETASACAADEEVDANAGPAACRPHLATPAVDMDELPQIGVESITRVVGRRRLTSGEPSHDLRGEPDATGIGARVRQPENPQKASGVYTPALLRNRFVTQFVPEARPPCTDPPVRPSEELEGKAKPRTAEWLRSHRETDRYRSKCVSR